MSLLQFLDSPLVTLLLSAQCLHDSGMKMKSFRIEFAPGSRSGSKFSFQCKILSQNHINGHQSSFWNKSGSLPGQCTRNLVFLCFFCCPFAASLLSKVSFEYEFVLKHFHLNTVPKFDFHFGSNLIWCHVNSPDCFV